MIDSAFNEAPETYKARKELKRILEKQDYIVEEEVPLQDVTNNMGEEIYPPYRADMIVTKSFIIELDPETGKKVKRSRYKKKKNS
jgi:hypothetical protein